MSSPDRKSSPTVAALTAVFLSLMIAGGCSTAADRAKLDALIAEEFGAERSLVPDYDCTVGAHRGSSEDHLENSLAAIRAADQDPRYAFIEFDVQYSGDGRIVLFHDKRLFRLYGRLLEVGETDYDVLLEASAGEIGLYSEALAITEKKLIIEIKSVDELRDRALVDELVSDLRARGRLADVMLSSISPDVIAYISREYPELPAGQVFWLTSSTYLPFGALTEALYEDVLFTGADYILLHTENLRNLENLLRLKPADKTIIFWDFSDRMYLVHKDPGDRLWGEHSLQGVWRRLRYSLMGSED